MRQHVNPLSQFFQLPLSLPSKNILFEKSHYPIHLDIGSAKGEFLIELATKYPDWKRAKWFAPPRRSHISPR